MTKSPSVFAVQVSFAGPIPTAAVRRASGVSDVDVEQQTLQCRVYGSFQPFLEALRGYEVMTLVSRALSG